MDNMITIRRNPMSQMTHHTKVMAPEQKPVVIPMRGAAAIQLSDEEGKFVYSIVISKQALDSIGASMTIAENFCQLSFSIMSA